MFKLSSGIHRRSIIAMNIGKLIYSLPALLLMVAAPFPAFAQVLDKGNKNTGNMVTLPTIAVAIKTDDGGWHHVKIDAYLDAKNPRAAKILHGFENMIRDKADKEIPNHSFETLRSPELGSIEAKKCILVAVEESLGHPFTGEVLIRNMLVY